MVLENTNRIVKRLFAALFVCVFFVFGGIGAANAACNSGEIDVAGDGTRCETTKFSLTTTSLSADDTFKFSLNAQGTFYVDCGADGVLSGTGVSGKTITRSNTTNTTYTCTYSSAGAKTINFAGTATGYGTSTSTGTISFYQASNNSAAKIASISGNLSSIFPWLSGNTATGAAPRFHSTFRGATNLTSIPDTLFTNYTTGSSYMFYYAFYGCTGLTSIPAELFSGITTGANYMFAYTFQGCTNITGYIPPTTFKTGMGINYTNMWQNTFNTTQLASSCPTGTTQYFTGYEGSTANTTWNGKVSCVSTTPIEITLDTTGADGAGSPTTIYLVYNTGWYSDSAGTNPITQLTTLPTKTGKVFGGFYTGQNATGTKFIDEAGNMLSEQLKFTIDPITLYVYFGDNSYTTTYSCGTGTGTAPTGSTVISGGQFTPATNTCTKSGYLFAGWLVSGTQTTLGNSATTWNYNENKTLTAQWVEEPTGFTITTLYIATDGVFSFNIAARGTFVVDCGAGGVLSSTAGDVAGSVITRSNTTFATYTCTYSTGSAKTIKFGGTATGYGTAESADVSAINFNAAGTPTKIATVSGSMGSVFPTLGSGSGQQPIFYGTFKGATQLTTISDDIFDGITGAAPSMFRETFDSCTKLRYIPEGLFDNISDANLQNGVANLFRSTFNKCTTLATLPEGLFAGVTKAADSLFKYSFNGCTGFTGYIPPSTYAGLIAAGSPTASNMWESAFTGENSLATSCPEGTVQYITGYESYWDTPNKVSCQCAGATYLHNGSCTACPTGYTADTSAGKTSENQCKIHCNAGTYLENAYDTTCSDVDFGYWVAASDVSYGQTGTRTACENGVTTPTVNGASAADCSVALQTCEGAMYYSPTAGECVACPTGYTADTSSGKVSENQCKIHCNAGTYIANVGDTTCSNVGVGYYAPAADIAYGDSETHTACPENTTTSSSGSTSVEACNLCTGATYGTNGTCTACPTGYNGNTDTGKTSSAQCAIHCNAGTYLAHANDATCSDVGIGYWAAASDVLYGQTGSRTACESGTTTAGANGTSAASCVNASLSCTGATYYDSDTGECTACPAEYVDNIDPSKTSINQCQKQCAAGTWLESYTPVEYLQGNGTTTFIDTGYLITSNNIRIEAVLGADRNVANNVNYGNFCGNLYKDPSGNVGFSGGFKNNVFGLWSEKAGKKAQVAKTFSQNRQYSYVGTMDTSSISVTIDNGTPGTMNGISNVTSTPQPLKLFTNGGAVNNNGTVETLDPSYSDQLFPGLIYSFKLYDGNTLALDLVPVRRNSDNALGMLNLVNGDFYTNSGTGTFSTGTVDTNATFVACSPVGDGYYNPINLTNYGSNGTRNQCPGGVATGTQRATSVRQCTGVTVYTVSYSCGDGTGTTPSSDDAVVGMSFVPAANTCSRNGSTFAGWAVSGTNDIKTAGTAFTWNYASDKTLTAQWTQNTITCSQGYYLPMSANSCSTCPANSYCAGGDYEPSNSIDQGAVSCPNEYATSAAGAGAQTDCYTSCTATEVPHATSFDGGLYYGGASTCVPADSSSCENGYSYVATDGNVLAHCAGETITIDYGDGETGTCTYGETFTLPSTPPTRRGYTFTGWTFE